MKTVENKILFKNTFIAALLMKAFAGSDQIAGTVITHLISLICKVNIRSLASFRRDCFRYRSDSENTKRAGKVFPFSSSIRISWFSDYKTTIKYRIYNIKNPAGEQNALKKQHVHN